MSMDQIMATGGEGWGLSEEEWMLKCAVRELVEAEISPRFRECDTEENAEKFYRESMKKLGEAGFLRAWVPEEFGGYGQRLTAALIVTEEVSRGNGALGMHVFLNPFLGTTIARINPVAWAGIGEKVLDGVNITIEPGELVGIIGSTGSGKTTLVSLIPRLYDADSGEVLIDGVNVKDYSLENLRDGIAVVLQKNTLFTGTIADNLRWGNEEATDEELIQAASIAQADGFIRVFPQGYDSDLERGGSNLSGGQRQRLCIARALLKKPKILILDDSTSAVDMATEASIRKGFREYLTGTTKLIIAQRITSVADADKIIVMDGGKIVGVGTHGQLMKSCPTYQEIFYSQKDREEAGIDG